jgi:hypothetical protein
MIARLTSFLADLDLNPIQGSSADTGHLQAIVNSVLAIAGAIAVLIVVLAGFRYIISQGNPNDVATAKNAIIYSLIGLVVIICAFAIVNFVVLGVT